VILGSSGNIGASVIKHLATKFPSVKVLAGVRDPNADKSKQLKVGPSVHLVAADLSKPDSLHAAIPKGVDAVFVNTPGDQNRTALAINGIHAAKHAHAKHVVIVSVLNTDSKGSVFGDQFAPIEAAAKSSGVPYTLLRLPLFIDNNWANKDSIKGQGKIYGPVNPDAKFTPIAVEDVGEAAAAVLANPGSHANKTYRLTTKAFSHNDLAKAFSHATGKQVDYVHVSYDDAKKAFLGLGFPEWQVDGILELYKDIDSQASYYGETADVKTLTGREPTTIDQWTQQVGGAFK